MNICVLSRQHFQKKHVSQDTIDAFETSLTQNNNITKFQISEFVWKLNCKIISKIKIINGVTDKKTLNFIKNNSFDYIFIMAMSYTTIKYMTATLKKINIPKVVYCIDTWTSSTDKWQSALNESGVDYVLCSNKASVNVFKRFVKNVSYLPYSMNQKYFYPRDTKKTRLFMQMGRKNFKLHSYALQYLKEHNLSTDEYVYEKVRGKIIFPDFTTLATEINKTKFFIVSPRNIDESNITGNISDVTARFYEGMACKTMLIGFKPKDSFDELFPSENAMITVNDYKDFSGKIDYYLKNNAEYEAIVNKNYQYLINNHTWEHRAKQMLIWLSEVKAQENNDK